MCWKNKGMSGKRYCLYRYSCVVPDEYRCKGNVGTYDGISDSVRDERTSE